MRTSIERSQIKSILQSPQWKTIVAVAQELCVKVKTEPLQHETEWQTISSSLIAEGKERGIAEFLQTLEREAFGAEGTAQERDVGTGD